MNNLYSTTLIDISKLPFQSYVSPSNNFKDIELKSISDEFDDYNNHSINRDRVLIFVMEQVSYENFVDSSNMIPEKENFFNRVENDSHYFTNYYTQNQDSLTGLWSLLFSKFIPFESYINNWNEKFGFVLENENVVDLFNYHNYTTTVALSQLEDSLILGAFDWDKNIFLPKFPVNDSVCVDELEYQSGCEDVAIIENVTNSIKNDEKVFLFQEFIFGHSESYIIQSGMNRVEYYNMYLNLIYDFLEQENLVENTTIVVISDHGNKGFSSKKISNYKIPFIIIDSKIEHKEIGRLYSHLDFKDILISYLDDKKGLPPQRNEVFIIGQTASSEFAYINSTGSYFTSQRFFKDVYVYDSFAMNNKDVKKATEQILFHQEISRNLSSFNEFYCIHCEKNKEDIIQLRDE
ncbi:MAG: sulfatase-like hydrolase/transferase [Nanobdellota archaeon]